jgi:hypothetical protein
MVQARWHPKARAYLARKRAEGKTGAETRRYLALLTDPWVRCGRAGLVGGRRG